MPNYGAYRFTRVAGPTPDAPDVYSPLQAGWVSPGRLAEHGASGLDAARDRDRQPPTPRPRPMASRSAPSLRRKIRACWCWTASSRRNPSTRCFSSRNAGSPGTTRAARTSSSCSACSRRTRPRRRSHSCWAKPARRSSRRASTLSSPIWAADSADAIIRRSRSMSRWRRCSFPAVRSGSPTIAISSSRAASSGTHSRCTRGSGSIGRPARFSAFAADHVLDGGGLANLFGQRGDGRRHRGDRHLRHSEGRCHHGRAAFARRDRRIDARLRNAADHDRAGGVDRRGGLGVAARPDRVPAAQRAQDRRPDHDGKSVQRLGPHAGDSGQAGEASDLAAARRRESARTARRDARRHRRGLRHQGLRHRSGLFAGDGGNRPGGPDHHLLRSRRDGQRHRDGARQPGGGPLGRRGR